MCPEDPGTTLLAPGARLGPYEVTAKLGEGGMGVVYRATDTTLGREVALKVLPEGFANDPERHARFEREAKLLASLNHPNIATLYGLEHLDGQHVLVMELVDGEGLDGVIARGPLSMDDALSVARQTAEGLEAAHEKGIVHRDLKPANVKVRPDGTVKVVDFGLAKAWEERAAGADLTHSPTVTSHHTQAGVILGSAAYMSPEQARGKPVDKRADIWAFGVVLFEMLTGRRMFEGETISDMLAGVLRAEIHLDDLPEETPAAVSRLLRRCLERDPRKRLRDAGDAVLELADGSPDGPSADASHGHAAKPERPATARLAWAAVAVAAVATAVAVWALTRHAAVVTASRPDLTFVPKTFVQEVIYNARFLPGGHGIVYSAARSGNVPELFMLSAGESAARKLAPARTDLLSVSSSGELAVLTGATYVGHRVMTGTLARMSVDGSPRPLVEGVRDADWGPDGSLAIVRRVGGTDRLEYPIGTVLYKTSGYVSEPRVSANGKLVAFLDHQWCFDDRGRLKVVDRSGHVSTLSDEYWSIEGLAWAPDGATLDFSGAVDAIDLQPRAVTLGVKGSRRVFETPGRMTVLDVDRNGDWLAMEGGERYGLAVHPAGSGSDIDLSWLDSSWGPWLAPDGQSLLFTDGRGGPNYAVVTRKLDGSPITTLGEGNAQGFSPDGRWVAARIAAPPRIALYPTGPGSPRFLEPGTIEQFQNVQWFPDGAHLLVSGNQPSRPVRDYRLAIAGGAPEPVTPEGIDGLLSPDGKEIVARGSDGVWQLYPVAGGQARPIRGLEPSDNVAAWSPDSAAVFVDQEGEVPLRVERVDLATGRRAPALTIAPERQAGLASVEFHAGAYDSARGYAYGYIYRLSTLYLVRGAR